MRRAAASIAGLLVVAASVAVALLTLPPQPAKLHFRAVSYAALSGWRAGGLKDMAAAYARSCARIMKASASRAMGGGTLFGHIGDWQPACADFLALDLSAIDDETLRVFFERRFTPMAVYAPSGPMGLFTGYYEPEYPASLEETPEFHVPLYGRPADLVTVNLGLFSDALKGKRIGGRIEGDQLVPYPARAAIEKEGLKDKAQPVAWLRDPVDAFFLHIQGSGLLQLADGTLLRVGYAAQNGRDYTAVGRILVANGDLGRDAVSMQSIRQWLETHQDKAAAVMNSNQSYVFFRKVTGEGPIGSEGVALTPGYSLAVDRGVFPMGLPIWLETQAPSADGSTLTPVNRLMVAQDTGGAIKGSIRGDVFWGTGDAAGEIAGRMQSPGRYYVLLPNALAHASR